MVPAPVPREQVEGPLPVVPNRLYGKTNVVDFEQIIKLIYVLHIKETMAIKEMTDNNAVPVEPYYKVVQNKIYQQRWRLLT